MYERRDEKVIFVFLLEIRQFGLFPCGRFEKFKRRTKKEERGQTF